MKLSLSDLLALASRHGFPDPALAAAIAMAESGGDSCAQGDPNIGVHPCTESNGASRSFGLWQVNTPANPQYSAVNLLDPDYNASAAFEISSSGTRWQPWSTAWEAPFRSGYLGGRAPFRAYYRPLSGYERLVAPSAPPNPVAFFIVSAAVLAAAAGYAASERRRYT